MIFVDLLNLSLALRILDAFEFLVSLEMIMCGVVSSKNLEIK